MDRKKLFTALFAAGVLLVLTPLVIRLTADVGPGQDAAAPDFFPIHDPVTGKWGYIDAMGKVSIPPVFDWAGDFRHGRGLVEHDGAMGYIDTDFTQHGDWAITPRFITRDSKDMPAHGFFNGLALARDESGNWGYLSPDGKWAIEPQFAESVYFPNTPPVGDFSDGLAWIQVITIQPRNVVDGDGRLIRDDKSQPIKEDRPVERWGYIDTKGEIVIDPRYEGAQDFSEGLAAVRLRTHEKWGFIDRSEHTAISPQFDGVGRFCSGLCAVKKGEHWGYIDTKGQWVIEPQFVEAGDFGDGLAPARMDDLWGYIDTDGNWAIYPRFDNDDSYGSPIDPRTFEAGLARVVENGKVKYINTKGEAVWPKESLRH